MKCRCGFDFTQELIKSSEADGVFHAVIANRDYKAFIRFETETLKLDKELEAGKIDMQDYFQGMWEASQLVESLIKCPTCHRIILVTQNSDIEYYIKEL